MDWILPIVILFYVLTCLGTLTLELLNLGHLKKRGSEVPVEFTGAIDAAALQKSNAYTFANSRFAMVHDIYNRVIALVFIFGGILAWYNKTLFDYHHQYHWSFPVWGLIFVMLLSYAKTFLNIPFNLYQTFNIERRFGFNTMSLLLWLGDLLKSLAVSTVLISMLLLGAFWLVERLPGWWWFPVWAFFFIFTLFVIYISPYILEPLFNKFTPVGDEKLAADIIALLKKAGIEVSGVFTMDASKRTKHSNAYFTGLGRVKRIIIFDTLLEKLTEAELLAVLAHEAGHCRKKHVLQNLALFEFLSAIGAYIAFLLLESGILVTIFNLKTDTFFAKMIVLSFIAGIILWAMPLFFNAVSRHFEREADDFAVNLIGSGKPLADALIKLSADNLANLYPQPLYAYFNYSHPPVLERVRKLQAARK
ncbi:MAG: M48 family metallopeptidase [Victivallaceae bacterium]|nr:M48 family metallopeptidase [Victivallaceae bacterium]